MKSTDYFKKLQEQGKITSEDFVKFIPTVPEFEIPDAAFAAIEESFLTRERALADPKIGGKIRAEVYDGVDQNIAKILPTLDVFDANEIANEKDTHKKLKLLNDGIAKKIEKVAKDKPNQEEQVKELNKTVAELTERIKAGNTERENERLELAKKFDSEKGQILLDYSLKDKINKFTIADQHLPLKESITNIILTDLKSKHTLSVQDGQIQVQEIVNGVAKPLFNGNDPVTVEKLLEDRIQPYLKRNNVDDKKKDEPGRKTIQQASAVPTNQQTLADRRRLAAMQ